MTAACGQCWASCQLALMPGAATAASGISDVEENRFVLALDPDVEAVDREPAADLLVGNESPTPVSRHQRQDGIPVVRRLVGKIETGVNQPQHSAREDAEHNVWRLSLAIRSRHRTRFDGIEADDAVLVGCRAAEAHELRVRAGAAVARMGIAALRIRLPYLDHGIVDRHPIAVEHLALDANLRPRDVRR